MKLPREVSKSEKKNPRKLMLIAQPKVGKTTLIAGLKNCLIVDMDKGGADYVDGMKVRIDTLDEFIDLAKSIKQENNKEGKAIYDYIALDTVTAMEDLAKDLALKMYRNTAIGKNFDGDVHKFMQLPKGAAYAYVFCAAA